MQNRNEDNQEQLLALKEDCAETRYQYNKGISLDNQVKHLISCNNQLRKIIFDAKSVEDTNDLEDLEKNYNLLREKLRVKNNQNLSESIEDISAALKELERKINNKLRKILKNKCDLLINRLRNQRDLKHNYHERHIDFYKDFVEHFLNDFNIIIDLSGKMGINPDKINKAFTALKNIYESNKLNVNTDLQAYIQDNVLSKLEEFSIGKALQEISYSVQDSILVPHDNGLFNQHGYFPIELYDSLIPYFTPASIINFSQTSKWALTLFNRNTESKDLYQAANSLLNELLTAIVWGNQEKAEKIIQQNVDLLTVSGVVTTISGYQVGGTALQLALAADDVAYHRDEIAMTEMIQNYFVQLPDGKDLMNKQIVEYFPVDWEEEEAKKLEGDLKVLAQVMEDISNKARWEFVKEQHEPLCITFHEHLSKRKDHVIKNGLHFNIQLLIGAVNLLQKYNDSVPHNKRLQPIVDCFWLKFVGYIEQNLSANYAQALSFGMGNVIKEMPKKGDFRYLPRSFELNDKFYPFSYYQRNKNDCLELGTVCALGFRRREYGTLFLFSTECPKELSTLELEIYVKEKRNHTRRYIENAHAECGNKLSFKK